MLLHKLNRARGDDGRHVLERLRDTSVNVFWTRVELLDRDCNRVVHIALRSEPPVRGEKVRFGRPATEREQASRLRVAAGSVGLTGKQTGIYTEERPGGWNVIGRTPLELVNVAEGYFPLRVGHRVKFEQIDDREYRRRLGDRFRAARGGARR